MKKKNNKIKDYRIKDLLLNQKGMALLTTLIFVFILITFGVSLLIMTSNDTKLSTLQRDSTKAFYIAEAGVERTLYNLKKDFESSEDWSDGDINGYTLSDQENEFWKINYNSPGYEVSFGDGTYTVSLKINDSNNVTIKSKGKYNNSIRYVQVDAKIEIFSIWDNAICGGSGMTGAIINGNAEFRGSLHLLGKEGNDIAIELIGIAGVGNNYKGMETELLSRVPPLPKTIFNGEEVEFLNAKLRVKHGKVKLSGAAYIGKPDVPGGDPLIKETLQGVYVTDGFVGGTLGDNIHSDNGMENGYDLGRVDIVFPSLNDTYTDPETNTEYAMYLDYLKDTGLKINESEISANTASFGPVTDGSNSIEWDQASGTLTIEGIIWVDNADGLVIGKSKGKIILGGKGTLVSANATAGISIHADLLSNEKFPTDDSLGIISARDINLAEPGDANLNIMGAFYAENKITMGKQTDLVGTFVSNYIDMGNQVPSIYQVPELINNIPPGMPGATITYSLYTNNWHEVHE
ncbi:MAG: pilus assembly PilX N-terminal domain-containing protein [Actinomycetia bacterium]|nr:pilus assembly PilX N-terminal domain-containing protein [Actinomycetes bacterium]